MKQSFLKILICFDNSAHFRQACLLMDIRSSSPSTITIHHFFPLHFYFSIFNTPLKSFMTNEKPTNIRCIFLLYIIFFKRFIASVVFCFSQIQVYKKLRVILQLQYANILLIRSSLMMMLRATSKNVITT